MMEYLYIFAISKQGNLSWMQDLLRVLFVQILCKRFYHGLLLRESFERQKNWRLKLYVCLKKMELTQVWQVYK